MVSKAISASLILALVCNGVMAETQEEFGAVDTEQVQENMKKRQEEAQKVINEVNTPQTDANQKQDNVQTEDHEEVLRQI